MEKLAIIGTGIAGMGSAYFLHKHFDIEVFEKNNYVGGHTNTIDVNEQENKVSFDTGFMVFNKVTYPNLNRLFDQLNVPIKKTDMSFSVQHKDSKLEYCGSGLSGLFGQRKNVFNLRYIKMLSKINAFNTKAIEILDDPIYDDYTIEQFITEGKYGEDFLHKYLIPMSGAVWSTPPDKMLKFPAKTLIRFFYNHGFLGLNTQHQWYTVDGGSESYKKLLIKEFVDKIKINRPVESVTRKKNKIIARTKDGEKKVFDKVLFASHADQTYKMLTDKTELEENLLKNFNYQKNIATVHSDESIMPKTKRVWSSWNYLIKNINGVEKTTTIYWMNSLQGVSQKKNYFVSIDDPGLIDKSKIIQEIEYEHPLFSIDAINAQKELQKLNVQNNNTYFCGSYFKYGFHEDAFSSAVEVSKAILGKEVW